MLLGMSFRGRNSGPVSPSARAGPPWSARYLSGACVASRSPAGALEPRFVAIHNALAAIGLAQVGPIREGILAEGREARLPLDLPAGCTTVVAVGAEGVRDLDVTLLGVSIAHAATTEPPSVLRACVDEADAYVLVVKAAAGSGSWVAATWQGGVGGGASPSGSSARAASEASGTCDSPIPLAAGTVSGSTARGESVHAGSCAKNSARELVYELDVAHRQRVTIEVEARFDSVVYLRKDDCADERAEVACNDDPPDGDRNQSRIERVLDPGKYFVFVDGYSQEGGSFKLTISASDVLALVDACRHAPLLSPGATATGTTDGLVDDAQATCGGGAEGPDAAWHLDLPFRSRVRIVEHSDAMAPVVHVRRSCADAQSEVACAEVSGSGGSAALTGLFDSGGYTVFADARDSDAAGTYSLDLELSTPAGSGTIGDGCGDALALTAVGAPGSISTDGDTFAARDDVAGSCGGEGAPDVVYRVDVTRRSRFIVALHGEEAPHILALWRRCADRGSEIACGRGLDEVLAPGSYFVAVDGAAADAFGRFTLAWAMQDLTAQGGACQTAQSLTEGRVLSTTTAGAGDRFASSCAGGDTGRTGADRVFRFALAARATVRLTLTAPFEAALALRKACADAAGGADVAELACAADADAHRHTTIERTLEAGAYWVVVDGESPSEQGPFTLEYRVLH